MAMYLYSIYHRQNEAQKAQRKLTVEAIQDRSAYDLGELA
jgi:hypothetical protein